jgi:NADH:ubiquinone oxidoreductase subunit 2 (subunit N)
MWVLVAVAAINSVIAAFYYLNVVRYMFFVPAEEGAGPVRVAPSMGGALAVTAVLTLLLGILPSLLIAWASASANTLLISLR